MMILASIIATLMTPTHRIAEDRKEIDFKEILPKSFGEWEVVEKSSGYIINPQTEQNLKDIYSQTLSRTYTNLKTGKAIMLSVAYGEEQSDNKKLHYPEFCYPAQGFQIKASRTNEVSTDYGPIKVKQLLAKMGTRTEPITYWSTVGDKVVLAGRDTKLEQLKYGLKGTIPDGILFRVSSIDSKVDEAYSLHEEFINTLISSLSGESRHRLAGLPLNFE